MADEKSDDEGSIFKVDTIPPPAGDGDAYSAPTKVGPVSADAWVELMKQADESAKKAAEGEKFLADGGPPGSRNPGSVPKPPVDGGAKAPVSTPSAAANAGPPPSKPLAQHASEEVPRLYEAEEDPDDSHAATMLSTSASKLVDSGARADAKIFGDTAASAAGPSVEESVPQSVLGPPQRQTTFSSIAVAVCIAIFAAALVYYVFSY